MSDRNTPDTENGAIKDPAEWTTGDEPMTGAQDSYVHTLARKAGEEVRGTEISRLVFGVAERRSDSWTSGRPGSKTTATEETP